MLGLNKLFSSKKKVLIVNEGDRKGLNISDALESASFEVVSIANSENCCQDIMKINPDLVIILVGNSKEVGVEILEKLKNDKIFIPTMLALDTEEFTYDIEETKKYGIVDIIENKEIAAQAAVDKIKKYLTVSSPSIEKVETDLKLVEPKGEAKNIKILLVEDYKELRETLAKKLSSVGYAVYLARDGEEAISEIGQVMPDIVLLDIIMPGINGFEVLKNVKKEDKTKNIPVIMLSNLGEEDDVQKARILGAVDYLIKANVTTDEIISKISYFIR